MTTTSRAYTEEECRQMFLRHVFNMIGYWAGEGNSNVPAEYSARERLEGLTHSIFATLDGCSMATPAFKIIPNPHPVDRQYHINEGENYWPDDVDIGGGLHEDKTWRGE